MNKRQALEVLPDILESAKTGTHANNLIVVPHLPDFSRKEMMQMEYDAIGVYISDDPLATYRERLKELCPISELAEHVDKLVTVGGRVVAFKELTTKTSKQMAFLTLEDHTDSVEVVVFPHVFGYYKDFLEENAIIELRGRVESSTHTVGDEDVFTNKVIADRIRKMQETKELKSVSIFLTDSTDLNQVKSIIDNNQGPLNVELIYYNRLYIPLAGGLSVKGIEELETLRLQVEKVYVEN